MNGIRLPYHVVHYAIEKAKENTAAIVALFLKSKSESSKGYIFPSDLVSSETSFFADQASSNDESIITDNMQLIQQMVENENISYQSISKANASIDEVKKLIAGADLVIVDENFDEDSLLSDDKISLKSLKREIDKPIDVVTGNA